MIQNQLFDGKYKILKTLGQGGMGTVYLAENVRLGTLWAIKEIHKKSDSRIDFLIEPNILKKLNHPALPRIFDIVEDENSICVIVDYIEGTPLDHELQVKGKFPEATVIDWTKQICEVLMYLHTYEPNPIIYRDMKPSNIILTRDGTIKLIDFGIAREYKEGSDNDTLYIGTRGYAAPEQYGMGQTNATTDIYSLGVTLYHLLTGKSPNEAPYELRPIRNFDKSFSIKLEKIINKCTKLDPKQRYQSAKDLLSDIQAIEAPESQEYVPEMESNRLESFRRLVLTVWDGAEFGCELAYMAAQLTKLNILLIDLDLLAPKADLFLNIRKYTDNLIEDNMLGHSGLNVVFHAIDKNMLTSDVLYQVTAKRKELKNLYVLTGDYSLENYEYYTGDGLSTLIEKAYQNFDITLLLVNRSVYDLFTVVSLAKSDYNMIPIRADIDMLREFNRYLLFLRDKQQIPLSKTKFVAYEYTTSENLDFKLLEEVTGHNYFGSISYCHKRRKYRNLKIPYCRRMESNLRHEYIALLSKFQIVARRSTFDYIKNMASQVPRWFKTQRKRIKTYLRRSQGQCR